jgi:hypothetical protein
MTSQTNNMEITCPKCKTKNISTNTVCVACGTQLNADDQSSTLANVVIGAVAVGTVAYQLWKGWKAITTKTDTQTKPAPPIVAKQPATSTPKPTTPQEAVKPVERPTRPRPQPGEHVDGWVTGIITTHQLPQRMISPGGEVESFEVNTAPPFYVGTVPIYPEPKVRYSKPVYAPPTAQFVFALNDYPSGHISQWGDTALQWANIDILWQTEEFFDPRTSQGEPGETPALRSLVDGLVQTIEQNGWERVESGPEWCNYRFRKKYTEIAVPLKWK